MSKEEKERKKMMASMFSTDSVLSEQLAEFVINTKYSDLPEDLIEYIKVLILKNIANMALGASLPHSAKAVEPIIKRGVPGDVGVLTYGFRASLWEGVFLNAFFAHAAELEDDAFFDADLNPAGPSWTITVIPLLLTLAQKYGLSGKELIEAIVVGLEVHRRTCLSTVLHRGVLLGPGSVGPAAGAAKAMGLNKEEIKAAMGLAISGPDMQFVSYVTDAHYFESAMQTLHAFIAAQMAQTGLTASSNLPTFLTQKFAETAVKPKKMLADLGNTWLCRQFWIKKYPASFGLHCLIDLMCEFKNKYKFSWEEIDFIEAVPASPQLGFMARTPMQTQFSLFWVLGVAAVDGDVNPHHMTQEALDNLVYQKAAHKIKQTIDPELSKDGKIPMPFSHTDELKVYMKDGRVFSGKRRYPIGSAKDPLTNEQIKGLFRKFSAPVFSTENIEKISEVVLNLEKLNNLDELMDLLTYDAIKTKAKIQEKEVLLAKDN